MKRKFPITEEEKAKFIIEMHKKGLSTREIERLTGVYHHKCIKLAKKYGYKYERKYTKFEDFFADEENKLRFYDIISRVPPLSTKKICEELGICKTTLYDWLRRLKAWKRPAHKTGDYKRFRRWWNKHRKEIEEYRRRKGIEC